MWLAVSCSSGYELTMQFYYPLHLSKDGTAHLLPSSLQPTRVKLFQVQGKQLLPLGDWKQGQPMRFKEVLCSQTTSSDYLLLQAFRPADLKKPTFVGRSLVSIACQYKKATFFLTQPNTHIAWSSRLDTTGADARLTRRIGHQATLLSNGFVLLSGGAPRATLSLLKSNSIQVEIAPKISTPMLALYDLSEGQLREVKGTSALQHRIFHTATRIGEKVMLYGGVNAQGQPISKVDWVDLKGQKTTPPKNVRIPTCFTSSMLHHTHPVRHEDVRQVFHVGGIQKGSCAQKVRIWHSTTWIAEKKWLVIAGGLSWNPEKEQWSASKDIQIFDLSQDPLKVVQKLEFPEKEERFGHTATWIEKQRILLFSGGAALINGSLQMASKGLYLTGLLEKTKPHFCTFAQGRLQRAFHSMHLLGQSATSPFFISGGVRFPSAGAPVRSFLFRMEKRASVAGSCAFQIKRSKPLDVGWETGVQQSVGRSIRLLTGDIWSVGGVGSFTFDSTPKQFAFQMQARAVSTWFSPSSSIELKQTVSNDKEHDTHKEQNTLELVQEPLPEPLPEPHPEPVSYDGDAGTSEQKNTEFDVPPEKAPDLGPVLSKVFERCSTSSDCQSGLKCVNGFCLRSCNKTDTQSRCQKGEACIQTSGTGSGSYCIQMCDIHSFASRSACPSTTRCTQQYKCFGFCSFKRALHGKLKADRPCDPTSTSSSKWCDTSLGLRCLLEKIDPQTGKRSYRCGTGQKDKGAVCNEKSYHDACKRQKGLICTDLGRAASRICRTTCVPRTPNPCAANEYCYDVGPDLFTKLGVHGVCLRKGILSEDQRCDEIRQPCQPNLLCIHSKCERSLACDPRETNAYNDPILQNTRCAADEYCFSEPSKTWGWCRPLPKSQWGGNQTYKEKEPCSNQLIAGCPNKKQDLTCNIDTLSSEHLKCVRACDPYGKKPSCQRDEECVISFDFRKGRPIVFSHLGGKCVKKAKRKEGQSCDHTHNRCVAGLVCEHGTCLQTCTIQDGVYFNAACTQSNPHNVSGQIRQRSTCFCAATSIGKAVCEHGCEPVRHACGKDQFCSSHARLTGQNFCRAKDSLGVREEGAACSSTGLGEQANCKKGLFCISGKCVKPCTVGKKCSLSSLCQKSRLSPLGGFCPIFVRPFQSCNPKTDVCLRRSWAHFSCMKYKTSKGGETKSICSRPCKPHCRGGTKCKDSLMGHKMCFPS